MCTAKKHPQWCRITSCEKCPFRGYTFYEELKRNKNYDTRRSINMV